MAYGLPKSWHSCDATRAHKNVQMAGNRQVRSRLVLFASVLHAASCVFPTE